MTYEDTQYITEKDKVNLLAMIKLFFLIKLVFPYMKGRSHTALCAYVGHIREADVYFSYLRSIGKVFIASVNTVTRKVRVVSLGCGMGKRDRRIRWDETELHTLILKIRV